MNNYHQNIVVQYTPLVIANTFISRYIEQHKGIEHFKLQKLVYFSYSWWLTGNTYSLCKESPQVWPYGPIFASLYHSMKIFGHKKLCEPVQSSPFVEEKVIKDSRVFLCLDWVWNRYGSMSAETLSEFAHEKGSPWQITAEKYNYRVPKGLAISDSLICSLIKQ